MARISQTTFKKNTTRAYESTMLRFRKNFGERDLDSLTSEEVLSFLTRITEGRKQLTRRI